MQRTAPVLNLALKTAILASGKKQKRVAVEAHIDETTLSHIVRGRREPSDDERKRLARVLGRTVDQLFGAPPQSEVA